MQLLGDDRIHVSWITICLIRNKFAMAAGQSDLNPSCVWNIGGTLWGAVKPGEPETHHPDMGMGSHRALPPLRSAPANAARGWRIGPGTDPKASSCDSAPRFDQRFCLCCHGFFLWLGSWRARQRRRLGPATQRRWAAKRSACLQKNHRDLCAVLSLTRFAVGSALSIDSGLRAPPGSPATLWGVTAGGPAPPESHRSGRRSAPHTIRLLFEVGSSFCRLPCFVRAKVLGARIWVLFCSCASFACHDWAKPPQ